MNALQQSQTMSISEVVKLPARELLSMHHEAKQRYYNAHRLMQWIEGAIAAKYDERMRAVRDAAGKTTGTVHLQDEHVTVSCDVPKYVDWDQAELKRVGQELMDAGIDPAQWIERSYHVTETRYKAMPAELQAQVNTARTVRPGKAKYSLAYRDTGAHS